MSESNQIELPLLVQTSELYDRVSPKPSPARPGKLTKGRAQLKFRDSGFSPPPPVSFNGSSRAVDESESERTGTAAAPAGGPCLQLFDMDRFDKRAVCADSQGRILRTQ